MICKRALFHQVKVLFKINPVKLPSFNQLEIIIGNQ